MPKMKSVSANSIQTKFLGELSYAEGLELQSMALQELERSKDSAAILLGLEHFAVATLGVRGVIEDDIGVSADEMRLKGVELFKTARGGQATIHSPGQLVIYPCVNLRLLDLGPRDFVQLIERATANWLCTLGIECQADSREPGLFVNGAKLVAFGFKISRGLTSHGLAVNVSNDLSLFDLIRTCGIAGQPMARLCDFGVSQSVQALFLGWSRAFEAEVTRPRASDVDVGAVSPLLS